MLIVDKGIEYEHINLVAVCIFMYGAGKASYTVSRLGVVYCRALLWWAHKPALYSGTIKAQLVVLALIIVNTINISSRK